MKVVILAGGYGTRISEESVFRPKPMIEIGGYPILWHIMKIYSHYGFNDFIICLGYKGSMIKEFFSNYFLYMSDVTFDFQQNNHVEIHQNVAEPWRVTLVDTGLETQTGGRIARIRPYIGDEPFMITYGDGVSDIPVDKLVEHHRQSGNKLTVTAIQPGGRFGVMDIAEDSGKVRGFAEKAKEDGGWINAGFMVAEQEVFDYLDTDTSCIFERAPMERLSADGLMGAYKYTGFWQCMDTQRDKGALERMWNSGKAPWKIWKD